MTVYTCSPVLVGKVTKSLAKTFDKKEKEWMEKQKVVSNKKFEKSCRAAMNLKAEEYVHTLMKKCKTLKGSFTNLY